MIQDPIAQFHFRGEIAAFVQVFVHGVSPGENHAGDQDLIADLQSPDFLLGKWRI